MYKNNPAALGFEIKIGAAEFQGFGDGFVAVRGGVKHEEAAGAGTEQFAADGSGAARFGVPGVNRIRGDAGGEAFL